MPRARPWRFLVPVLRSAPVVFSVALLARLRILSELLPDSEQRYFYQYNEPARIAWALVSGFGYSSPWPHTPLAPTAQQPPLYPYLLAGIFRLTGAYTLTSLWIAVGLNAVVSAFTAVLILRLAKQTLGEPTAILAAWLWSCWLYEAVVSVRLWESCLSAFLLTVALLLLPKLARSPRILDYMLLGALAGLASLNNTTLLAVFPFFWIWLWVSGRTGKSTRKLILASLATCVLIILPWTIRNYETFHRLIPVRDNFGLELWIGNHEGVTNRFPTDFPLIDPTEFNRLGEIRFMEAKRDIAFQFIRTHPVEFARLSTRRMLKFWVDPGGVVWIVSLLAWTGLAVFVWRERFAAFPYAAVMIFFPLAYYVTHTFSTYRHPIEPVVVILASYALVTAISKLMSLSSRNT